MRAVVGYESMYGNTRQIAEAIGEGLRSAGPVAVVPVNQVTDEALEAADLLVVGAPTHAHGLRRLAAGRRPRRRPTTPPRCWSSPPKKYGVREWTTDVQLGGTRVAAFDTRADLPALVSGRASKQVMRQAPEVRRRRAATAESFLVDRARGAEARGARSRPGLGSDARRPHDSDCISAVSGCRAGRSR